MTDFSATVAELSSSFNGRVLLPKDPDWDTARRVHNGLVDKRPALIAQCRGSADIASGATASKSPFAAAVTTSAGARPSTAD